MTQPKDHLEARIRAALQDPQRALPAWNDPMPRIRREARRQWLRLIAVTGTVAAATLAVALALPLALLVPRQPPPAALPRLAPGGVTAKVPSSCQVITRAVHAAGYRNWRHGLTFHDLAPLVPLAPDLYCSYGPRGSGDGGPYLGIAVGKESVKRLEAGRAAKGLNARNSHPVTGLGLWAFIAGRPASGETDLVVQNIHGLVIEVVSNLTLRQVEPVVRQLLTHAQP